MSGNGPQEDTRSLGENAFAGVRWSGGAHVFKQVLTFGTGLLLMRLLSPESFGLLGMAVVVTGLLEVIGSLGLGSAIVQRNEVCEAHLSGAFWVALASGASLAALAAGLAPLVAGFFQEPKLTLVLPVLSLIFVLRAVGVVPKALLQRRMDFSSLARIEVPAIGAAGLVAVLCAWLGAGVWSLVAQQLVTPALEATAVWGFIGWRPKIRNPIDKVGDLASFGLNLTGFHLVNYVARHADDLLIGRIMGSSSLGLYDRAYSLMLLPITQVIRSINRVVFPTLAMIREDHRRMRSLYLRVLRVLTIISFPMMIGLAVVADPLVRGVFGSQWAPMIPVVRILCLVGLIQTLANPTGWIYTATGRTDWMMLWGLVSAGVLIGSIVVGVVIGSIEAVAWTYAGGNLLLLYPGVSIAGKLIELNFSQVARAASAAAATSLLMAAPLLGVLHFLLEDWSSLASVAVLVPLGVILYLAFNIWLNPEGCREVLNVLQRVLPGAAGRMRILERHLL